MRILITAGGTEESLDGVRRLTNTSTGATGLVLAHAFAAQRSDVVLLHAGNVDVTGVPAETEAFRTFDDLAALLERQLGARQFDAVVHLAAVSDYHLASIEADGEEIKPGARGKIGSGHELVLRLKPNPKLIDSLKSWSLNPDLTVVGFKLTDTPDPAVRQARIDGLFERGTADLVVHNDLREIDEGRHIAAIHSERGLLATTQTKNELAEALLQLLGPGDNP